MQIKQESVRPRWPYDMRPSVRAEKYIRDASGWRKDVTDGNDNVTDRQTDRVRRNIIIIIIITFISHKMQIQY